MSTFEFVLAILGICFLYKLIDLFVRQRAEQRGASAEQESSDEVAARLAELEERIQVLERIVTDERLDLKREFRDLGS